MKNFRTYALALGMLAALSAPPVEVKAQVVTQLPQFTAARIVTDLGNGPTEIRMLGGSLGFFTSQGSGLGSTSGSSTTLTLTATPATVPCTGCVISGTGITSGTTVSAFSAVGATVTVTLSAAMTVAASTSVAWGAACPASPPTSPLALVQAGVGADLPFYTQARVCAYGGTGPGGTYLPFAIGAH